MKLIGLLLFAYTSINSIPAKALDGDLGLLPIGITGVAEEKKKIDAGDVLLKNELKQLCIDADKALKVKPTSVTDHKKSVAGLSAHDYVSYAPYWWPNPKTKSGLPFIRKDGNVYEKLRVHGDQAAFGNMVKNVQILALAFYDTNNEKYAVKATQFLRVWFFDPATKMNPNVEGGQIIMGIRNKGRRAGINEMRFLSNVIDAETLLMHSKAWTNEDHHKLQLWFGDYFKWLTTSNHGEEEQARPNNHGTWYDVQYTSIAIYLGKVELAKKVFEVAKEIRIKSQIRPDGSMPLELERASSLHYSLYNVTAMFALATLAEKIDIDLWNYTSTDGKSMRKALDYTTPYIDQINKWPHSELRNDESWHWPFLLSQATRAYHSNSYRDLLIKAEKASKSSCSYCYRLTI